MPDKEILIIDDDVRILDMLNELFENVLNIEAETAVNGLDGLNKIDRRAQLSKGQFKLIITDYSMPEMDGITFTEIVNRRYPTLPVVMMSAYNESVTLLPRIRLHKYFTKPLDIPKFIKTIEGVIRA
ncbi:MAG: response regulator [Candidatus Delongbacteria bacterium]|nr:response regulator [Candidatus Delongbacteria bacterium]MBN2834119.1 response regulator [Candidatus Delongbacteria bacterium]